MRTQQMPQSYFTYMVIGAATDAVATVDRRVAADARAEHFP